MDKPTLGSAAEQDTSAFATASQGSKADSAVQPGGLATVATSGSYNDLSDKPTLGSASEADVEAFATAIQGGKADTAIQPAALVPINTALDMRIRVDEEQALSPTEQSQARAN